MFANVQDDDEEEDEEGDPADVQAMKLHFKQVRVRPQTRCCRAVAVERCLPADLLPMVWTTIVKDTLR